MYMYDNQVNTARFLLKKTKGKQYISDDLLTTTYLSKNAFFTDDCAY